MLLLYIYIYIYILCIVFTYIAQNASPGQDQVHGRARLCQQRFQRELPEPQLGRGQMGSALMGSLQLSFFYRNLFGYSRQPTFIFPKVPGRICSPNLSKFVTFCSGPISVDPMRPQPISAGLAAPWSHESSTSR